MSVFRERGKGQEPPSSRKFEGDRFAFADDIELFQFSILSVLKEFPPNQNGVAFPCR